MNPEAVVPAHASQPLAAELWISLVSLLRSHIAMHSIARPAADLRILSSSESAWELLGRNGKLRILAPDASGTGATEFRPEAGELGDEYSAFFFTEDGLCYFEHSNEAIEIEAAVEHLLGKVQA